jgi:hypothetical protein
MYIRALEAIRKAYPLYPSPQPVSMCIPPVVAKRRLAKSNNVAINTHATIEEYLDTSFSMRSVSYERKVGDCRLGESQMRQQSMVTSPERL